MAAGKVDEVVSPHTAMIGVDAGVSFASLLEVLGSGGRRNSSRAPRDLVVVIDRV
jgi:hypothetical protein